MIGLIASGQIKKSLIARLPRLLEQLGPIKSSSYRVASRMANTIRAGHPVENWEEFRNCAHVFLTVPDKELQQIVAGMLASHVNWEQKAVVLCDTLADSSELRQLAGQGAMAASLDSLEGFDDRRFVAEGHRGALRELRRLLEHAGAKVLELKPHRKPVYLAGLASATSLVTPLLVASDETLRLAGIRSKEAQAIIERAVLRTIRGFLKAGRKSWSGPLADRRYTSVKAQIDALEKVDPLLAEYADHSTNFAVRRLVTSRKRKA